MERRRNLFV